MKTSKAVKMTVRNAFFAVKHAVKYSMGKIAWGMLLVLPYAMFLLGESEGLRRGNVSVGGEVIIPIIVVSIAAFLLSMKNKLGLGNEIPIVEERFTDVHDDGQVDVPEARLQEMILYVADVEDYIERQGLK